MSAHVFESFRREGRLDDLMRAARVGWSGWRVNFTLTHDGGCGTDVSDVSIGTDEDDAFAAAVQHGPSGRYDCTSCGTPFTHWHVDRVDLLGGPDEVQRAAAAATAQSLVTIPALELKRLYSFVVNAGGDEDLRRLRAQTPIAWEQFKRMMRPR